MRAIKDLLVYLRQDPAVFAMLKPNKLLVRKMNLERFILGSSYDDGINGLEMASFLLRYHAEIDYGDFSDDPYVI